MKKYQDILEHDKYYTKLELKHKLKLTSNEINEYKTYKYNKQSEICDNLISFNSKNIYIINHNSLESNMQSIKEALLDSFENYNKLPGLDQENIKNSFLFSEIEGSIEIEGVHSTKRRIEEIFNGAKLIDKNDQIVKNMINAWNFINSKPTFNKENLFKLYNLLSNQVLDKEDELKEKNYYRHDYVGITDALGQTTYDGCPHNEINDSMNSLFEFVNKYLTNKKTLNYHYLPHITHYYILLIHPYFDYNGRCARAVSLWIMLLLGNERAFPMFLGEAINNTKNLYYKAIVETRKNENDLTYFINYILDTSIKYYLMYNNLEHIKQHLLITGETLSETDEFHLLRIMLNSNNNYFGWKDFIKFTKKDISKQAALKALKRLEDINILESIINKSKIKMFKLSQNMINYKI